MPITTYTYAVEEPFGPVVVSDTLLINRRNLRPIWPAPKTCKGHFRPLTVEDLVRLEHLAALADAALSSMCAVRPADLGEDDPEQSLIDACDALDDAVGRVRAALERAYATEAA